MQQEKTEHDTRGDSCQPAVAARRQPSESAAEGMAGLCPVLLESLPLGICFKNRELMILASNRRFAGLFGREPESVRGMTAAALFAPRQAHRQQDEDRRVLEDGLPRESHLTLRRNGITRRLSLTRQPLTDSRGEITGLVWLVQDLARSRSPKRALREQIARYRKLFRNLRAGFAEHELILDDQGRPADYRFLEMNREFERQTGLKRKTLIGRRITEILPSIRELDFDWIEAYGNVVLTGHTLEVERYFAPLGKWFSVLAYRSGENRFAVLATDTTEQRRAEQALRESERRYREIFESSKDGIFLIDVEPGPRFVLREVNPSNERSLGLTSAQVAGRGLEELFDRDTAERLSANYRHCLESGRAISYEEELELPSGRSSFFTTLQPLADANGTVYRIVGIAHDITARKQTEQRLRDSESRYRILFESAGDGILIHDLKGRFLEVNQLACQNLGYSRDELLGLGIADIDTPRFKQQAPERLERLTREGFLSMESEHLRRDGTAMPVEINARMIDYYGRPAVLSVVRDITARKQANEERELLQTVIEQAAENILVTDHNGTIVFVNPAFERLSGYSRQEAIGRTPSLLKSGVHDREFYRRLWDTINAKVIWFGRVTNRSKEGKLYHEETIISPILDPEGRITHFVAVKRDVTQELELEAQLRHAQKLESIGQLAGGVAHDFNNILTSIMGYASLLRRRPELPEKMREWVEEILRGAHTGADITRQLLTFSRKHQSKLESIDLNEVVQDALKLLGHSLGPAVTVESRLVPELARLNADKAQLSQILINLCLNARDAMNEGRGRILIETSQVIFDSSYTERLLQAQPGPYALLSVTDDGRGMDDATRARIFEPFFTTKTIGKGTGLGLSIVYGIVRNHGGMIHVYSEPGQGSTFKIYLPQGGDLAERIAGNQEPVRGGEETILVVDDEQSVLKLVDSILKEYGYMPLLAEDGRQALKLFERMRDRIDLVLTDVVMPGMNGPELFEALRAIDPRVPVVMCSGFSLERVSDLEERGVRAFVSKPYQVKHLVRVIREVLDRGKGGGIE